MTEPSPPRADTALPLCLSVIAGFVDVTTFVSLDGLFSAHVTGNLAVTAAKWVAGTPVGLVAALAIPVYIGVTAVATAVRDRSGTSRHRSIRGFLVVQSLLITLAATFALFGSGGDAPTSATGVLTGLTAVTAMSVQNAMLHLDVSPAPSTAVMTGNIVAAAVAGTRLLTSHGEQRALARRSWWAHAPLVGGFFIGCLAAAATQRFFGAAGWLCAVAASIALTVIWSITAPGTDRAEQRGQAMRLSE